MSTNFEHRARERQQASEAQREKKTKETLIGPFIRGKIRRVLHKTQTFRINGTFRLK